MAARGICDRVAIVGMGCTAFGEHWNRSTDDLIVVGMIQQVAGTGAAAVAGVPDVRGLTLRAAVRALHNAGFRVRLLTASASGTAPAAGTMVAPGTIVELVRPLE